MDPELVFTPFDPNDGPPSGIWFRWEEIAEVDDRILLYFEFHQDDLVDSCTHLIEG
jgi:hypothetical protein